MQSGLVDRFLAGAVPPREFSHAAHVEVAWSLLHRHDFTAALSLCIAGIKELAERAGAPGKFNLTITVAYFSLVAERIGQAQSLDWSSFASCHSDLLDGSALRRLYSPARLANPMAHNTFLLPDVQRNS